MCFFPAEVHKICWYCGWWAPRPRLPLEDACPRGLHIVESSIHTVLMTISLFPVRILSCSLLVLCMFLLLSERSDPSRMQERQLYSAVSNDGSERSQKHFGGLPTLPGSIAMNHNA